MRNCTHCGGPIDEHNLCFECDRRWHPPYTEEHHKQVHNVLHADCRWCNKNKRRNALLPDDAEVDTFIVRWEEDNEVIQRTC
jgi:hypothetical protein